MIYATSNKMSLAPMLSIDTIAMDCRIKMQTGLVLPISVLAPVSKTRSDQVSLAMMWSIWAFNASTSRVASNKKPGNLANNVSAQTMALAEQAH